jgi:hypothetical protein
MDRQEILKKLETEVSVVKDPELKKIAFEKLLSQEFEGSKKRSDQKKKKTRVIKRREEKGKKKTSQYFSIRQIREEVQKLNITGKIQRLPAYRLCKELWQKCLWVLAAAKKHKIDGLNNHEIAYILSKRLYNNTKYSSVNSIHKKVSIGYVTQDPETGYWRIAPDGEDHLANLEKSKTLKVKE